MTAGSKLVNTEYQDLRLIFEPVLAADSCVWSSHEFSISSSHCANSSMQSDWSAVSYSNL